jgi:phosphoribosylaminoimidazole-succinocarboxamide synthase
MTRGEYIRKRVSENLHCATKEAEIPGLGGGRRGKVRHVYSAADADGESILIMSTSDRVSAFDIILDRAIPYKGAVLNALAQWSFDQTRDIVPNALIRTPSSHIMIQRELPNTGFECVVRGYVWGSLAIDYERGMREKCGLALGEKLLRYQKLEPPLFTPTTKAKTGHDRDVTLGEMAKSLQENLTAQGIDVPGDVLAQQLRDVCFRLYHRGDELARRVGLSLVDTKYEFGIDAPRKVSLIDEIHTPDSSRYIELADWQKKWPLIKEKMQAGHWATVSELLRDHPDLKVKELSKQLVRDVLMERGYDPNTGEIPSLQDEDVVETSARYIELYERLTGQEFDFPEQPCSPIHDHDSARI